MIEMPITLEPYESYCNRLIEKTHKMVKEMHDIVHCKDCKYWEKEYDEYDGEEWWTCGKYEPYNSNDSMHEDDFCSRGEQR